MIKALQFITRTRYYDKHYLIQFSIFRLVDGVSDRFSSPATNEKMALAKENIELVSGEDVKESVVTADMFHNIFKCLRCEQTFENEQQLHTCDPLPLNINKQKKLKRVFKCSLCDKHYHFPSLAMLHMKRHQKYMDSKVVNACSVCGSKFQTPKALKDHCKQEHNIVQYQCNICDKLFKQSRNLQYHVMSHSGDKPFQCELCLHKFTRADHLARHRKDNCNQIEFECDLCGKIYNTKRGAV